MESKRMILGWTSKYAVVVLSVFLLNATALNSSAEGLGGSMATTVGVLDSEDIIMSQLSVSYNFTDNIGAQVDGALGGIDPHGLTGAGIHVFYRDPSFWAGLTYSSVGYDFFRVNRGGIEGEFYMNNFTFFAQAGKLGGDHIDEDGYGGAGVKFYMMEDFALTGEWASADDDDRWIFDAEYLTPLPGLGLFLNIAGGDRDYEHEVGGIRFYFGSQKSLMKKQREGGVRNNLFNSVSDTFTKYEDAKK